MTCSVCRGTGHNKRTCIAKSLDDSGLPDNLKEYFIDEIAKGISDEALAELISQGLDFAVPGAGWAVRLGRAGWRAYQKR
jgi:hypothetical protein